MATGQGRGGTRKRTKEQIKRNATDLARVKQGLEPRAVEATPGQRPSEPRSIARNSGLMSPASRAGPPGGASSGGGGGGGFSLGDIFAPVAGAAGAAGGFLASALGNASRLLPGGDSSSVGSLLSGGVGQPAAALAPGGALPQTSAPRADEPTAFDLFAQKVGQTTGGGAGAATGGTRATAGPASLPQTVEGFDAELGIHAPVIRDMIAREESFWDSRTERMTANYDQYMSDAIAKFEAAESPEDKAYQQAVIFSLEQQWAKQLGDVNLNRHQSVNEIMRYGLAYADQEQQQAQQAQQQQTENDMAQAQGAYDQFQQNLEVYGPDLQHAVGQTWAQELSAGLTDPSLNLGASGAAVQEAANLSLMGQPDEALAIVGAELQRLKGLAAEDETFLSTVDALNRLLARVIQAGNSVQEEGFGLLRQRSGL